MRSYITTQHPTTLTKQCMCEVVSIKISTSQWERKRAKRAFIERDKRRRSIRSWAMRETAREGVNEVLRLKGLRRNGAK